MDAAELEYAVGSGLTMFLLALIFLGLLALIPALRKPYGVRHVLAWLLGSFVVGWFLADHRVLLPLTLASLVSGVLMVLRYWWTTTNTGATSTARE